MQNNNLQVAIQTVCEKDIKYDNVVTPLFNKKLKRIKMNLSKKN